MTVNTPVPVAVVLSGLVTVTLPAPVFALPLIEMLAVSDVELLKVVELTVIPVAENDAISPLSKLVPVIVMFWFVAPWPRELGFVEVTAGATLTIKDGRKQYSSTNGTNRAAALAYPFNLK